MTSTRLRDLSPTARLYVGGFVVAGALTIGQSLYHLTTDPVGWSWTILAVLTLLSGSATVNLPSLPATVSVSETFVFTSVLLFGAEAGTLTVALDAAVISFWSYRKGHPQYKILFNVCALPLTLWIASHIYFALSPYGPLYLASTPVRLQSLLLPLLVFTLAYYAINTWVITVAISLERNLAPLKVWRDNFLWISLNYFGGASVAALLVSYTRDLDYTYLLIIVPLLVVIYLTFSTSMGRVEDANRHLSQLNSLYISTIETLAMAIDAKDQITHGHIRRVQSYAVGLAKALGVTEEAQLRAIEAAALLHDMGKLAVPEYILNKPGPLTPAEFEKMKLHASVGADILSAIDFPYPVVPIVRHHHENWDGTGYPDRLSAADIPLGARILSVVDCFDALTSDRPYRPRLSNRDAIRILQERRGKMYDPLIVDAFIRFQSSIGVVDTESRESKPLRAITAAAIPNASSLTSPSGFEDIAASSDEMLTLFEMARSLTGTMGVQDATDLICKHLRRLVPSSACMLFLYEEDADDLVAAHGFGERVGLIKGLRVPLGQRLSGWVAAHRQTVRNSDPILDLGESARAMHPRLRSCLATPLLTDGSLVGVLSFYSTDKEAYTEEHQRIVEVVAKQVASTIRQAQDFERNRKSTLRDQATGLPNLQHLVQFVDDQVTAGTPVPLSLILVKCTADGHASSFGDEMDDVLALVRATLRAADLMFRSDADEVVAVLLETDPMLTRAMTQRVRAALAALGSNLSVRIAVGVVSWPDDGHSPEVLLKKARASCRPIDEDQTPRSVH